MGRCYNTIDIDAPVDVVWNRLRNFHDMSWAEGVITDVKAVGDKGGLDIGAKRILNDAFHETLVTMDPAHYTFSYSIDDGPGPVAKDAVERYIGTVKLSPSGEGTRVEWSSEFTSAADDEVAEFCNPIYSALLDALKKSFA
ncbi:MAG: SRPBCC family protein [Marinobacter sp.]|uniref:SRPBCC family protein n=1 Tax=Marinobacter sp. TaxID=50741 RepID=UPI00299D3110|nr:SRPBCC family protein [Marinobacter sp.]MDX1757811.1 SRPBCC family protein [Marinobacter sp.]